MNTKTNGAQWDTKFINDLPDSSFAFIEPGGEKDSDGRTTPRSLRHLPYKDADGKPDLPHVRDALSRLSQTDNIPADKKSAIKTMLQNILDKAQTKSMAERAWHATAQLLADGLAEPPARIMLMKTGTWDDSWKGKLAISAEDLLQYKQNIEKGLGVPGRGKTGLPIDFAHEDNKEAAGWIKGLEVAPSDDPLEAAQGVMALYGNPVEWTSAGKQALVGGAYKCISPSFFPAGRGGWENPEDMSETADNVLVGAGLTNIPFFAGLTPVMASTSPEKADGSEKNVIYFAHASKNNKGEKSMVLDEVRVIDADKLTEEQKQFLADNKDKLSGDERKKFGLEASTEEDDKKVSDEDRQLLADIKDGKVKTVKADDDKNVVIEASRLERLETTAEKYEHEKAEAVVEAHVKRGAIKADTAERWINRLLKADETGRKELEDDLKALPSNEQLGKEQGSDAEGVTAATATAEMEKLANEKIAAAKKDGVELSPQDAFKQVNAERPDLYQAAYDGREKVKEEA